MSDKKNRSFKLRLSRTIPFFNLCRSKNKSNLPINPSPSFPRPLPGQSVPARRSSVSRHVSSALTSAVCGCRRSYDYEPDEFSWRKDDTWHVVGKVRDCESPPRRKIYTSAASPSDTDDDLASTPQMKMKHGKRRSKLKLRVSTSSVDTCAMFFSTDEETEQLISPSLTISTDETTSDRHDARVQKQSIKIKTRHSRAKGGERNSFTGVTLTSPPRLSVFQRVTACKVEGKVKESLAVVKRSEDPYGDFKKSMMEMILEKEMFDAAELQQLLECFLSLNSKRYYPTIVGAFSEVWETMFCKN
ncbi:unnamed protein product [Rhodiola kirilowii]